MTSHASVTIWHQNSCFYSWSTKKVKFTFGEQFLQSVPGQGAADLQPLGHDGGRDEFVVGNLFVQLVVGGLVEEHQVVKLIPHFSLGPLLLSVKEARLAMETVVIKSQGWILREHQPGLTFFLALPPDLLTGSLSFLDFPASFFLSGLGGCKDTKHVLTADYKATVTTSRTCWHVMTCLTKMD